MNIAVLCGGLSNERDVSVSSGTGIAEALRTRGHRVILLDLFTGYPGEVDDIYALFSSTEEISQFRVEETAPDFEAMRRLRSERSLVGPHVLDICKAADFVFLALHGEEGENGKLQAMFDLLNIRYTGSGYLGSALAMNKSMTKALLRDAGIPVPAGFTIHPGDALPDAGYPCVVKPCSGGSSVGTSIVQNPEDLLKAVELAFRYEDSVLVEGFVAGRELTVGVMDGRGMPVIEIIPKSGFYDYKNKYQPGFTEEICPAEIGPEATAAVQRMAEAVFRTLKIDAYCRVDFIMRPDGSLVVLEANTLPGMTPTSLIPQMAAAEGQSYAELCETILEVSRKKYEKSDS